jgi:rhodanese-related sulfurtransferase
MPATEIDPVEASHRLAQADGGVRPLLVDVREQGEFAEQRIPDATLLPMSRIPTDYQLLPRDRPLLIHCAHGQRSLAVAEFLARNGYPEVASISGGIVAWAQAGLPTKAGPVEPGEGQLTPDP